MHAISDAQSATSVQLIVKVILHNIVTGSSSPTVSCAGAYSPFPLQVPMLHHCYCSDLRHDDGACMTAATIPVSVSQPYPPLELAGPDPVGG